MSEEIYVEPEIMVEPDIENGIVDKPKDGGCGCKNQEASLENNSTPSSGSNKVLFIVLGVIVLGTFFYYVNKNKNKVAVDPA